MYLTSSPSSLGVFFAVEPNFFAVSAATMLEFLMTIMRHHIQLYLMDQIPPQEVNSQLIKDMMLEFVPCSLPHRKDLVFRLCDGSCKRLSYKYAQWTCNFGLYMQFAIIRKHQHQLMQKFIICECF